MFSRVRNGVWGGGRSFHGKVISRGKSDTLVLVTHGAEKCLAAYLRDARLWFSTRASPIAFAPSAPITLLIKLRGRDGGRCQSGCHRVLTVAEGQVVADLTLMSVELTVSMSATCLAPSTPNLLWPTL